MSRRLLFVAALMCVGLNGCLKPDAPAASDSPHGRYVGVGIYSPREAWTHILDAQQAKESAAARQIDDQAIIVVEDSKTGEVRACGDLTGYCVGMNPWGAPLPLARRTPISVSVHDDAQVDGTAAPAARADESRASRRQHGQTGRLR
jgi:hypothetical protein